MVCGAVSVGAVAAVTLLLLSHSAAVIEVEECDFYQGRWVSDKSYPLYRSETCPFVLQQFNCTGNGRSDLQYQKYRWQPTNCNLPRWNGAYFARKVRGKRIMFVGDSLSMNQWQSLACMINAAYPTTPYQPIKTTALLSTIIFPKLNITLMYLRNAFIVDLLIQNGKRVLKLDSVAGSSKQWLQSNLLIFDTWHWWLHGGNKQPWDFIQDGEIMKPDMDRLEAYEKALRTWGKWVDKYVNPKKLKIFFQGVSPDHWNATYWGMPELQRCGGARRPLNQEMEEGDDTNKAGVVLKEVLGSIKKRVNLLDINRLSQFRVDGHPSIYGNPRHIGMDCTHWCLPGVPDAWNQFLYATLLTI
ncbi:protein trichome birefringence-like 41 [Salvia miltiorrhiza]|uniref:protein trichome birefringence-like 41 n=1 Tax=Salvia miltiorrhiza TaxID=226208 RepID=UPI0025AD78F4|nr:protein trichome birefringence-like 41 [Salvia miltiorrhiza]